MKIDEKFIDEKLFEAAENEKGNRNGSSDYAASEGLKKGDPSKSRRDLHESGRDLREASRDLREANRDLRRDLREASGRALDHI